MDRASLNALFNTSTRGRPVTVKREKRKQINARFWKGIDEGDFSLFRENEYVEYFYYIAEQEGYKPFRWDYVKEKSISRGLLNEFGIAFSLEIINFLWKADHDLKRKDEIGFYILSKGWRNSLIPLVERWMNGETVSTKNLREWRDDDESYEDDLGGIIIE